jgi:DNA invertase Pin-like site-specific DNA recombinase
VSSLEVVPPARPAAMRQDLRVVAYCRQSVNNGSERLEAQAELVTQWCEQQGFRLVAIERETISGAVELEQREALARAIGRIRDGEAEAIVIPRLDSLSRRLHLQEAALGTIWRHGGDVYEVYGGLVPPDDPSDPYRGFIRVVLGAAAELEARLVVQRMQGGRKRNRAQGKTAGGRRPIGWRIDDDGLLVPNEREQRLLARARRLREQGRSWREISDRVGLPASTVRGILKREGR